MLDDSDLKILKAFDSLTNEKEVELSSWIPMRKIFKNGRERENEFVKLRIKRMCKMGLFEIKENSDAIRWTMNRYNVKFRRNFKFPDIICNAVLLKINDRWEIYQIN